MPAEELYGLPLRYIVDCDQTYHGNDDEIVVVGYATHHVPPRGIPVKYCDLDGAYSISDPKKSGYYRNIHEQLERAQIQQFKLITWGHCECDKFEEFDVKRALDLALIYKIGVLFKNPGALSYDPTVLIAHPNVFGIIVEKECGGVAAMDSLRRDAGKPLLPIWFVANEEYEWADAVAIDAQKYTNVGVTHSSTGDFKDSIDILVPVAVKNNVTTS